MGAEGMSVELLMKRQVGSKATTHEKFKVFTLCLLSHTIIHPPDTPNSTTKDLSTYIAPGKMGHCLFITLYMQSCVDIRLSSLSQLLQK